MRTEVQEGPRPQPLSKEEGGEEGESRGGGQGQPGRVVLTVGQAVTTVPLQAEILQLPEQLAATVDLGLARGEQAA